MKDKKIFVMTSSGPVPFDKSNISDEDRDTIKRILKDLFPKEPVAPEMTIPYYEAKIAEINGICPECVSDILAAVWAIYPVGTINILLRAIAMEMDMNYPNHISDAEELWTIDDITGEVFCLDESGKELNYRNFPAFRCKDDAVAACMILKPLFKSLYGGKQKNKGSKKG